MSVPLSDSVVFALARLVDDSQTGTREPSHSDLEFLIGRAGLSAGDPKAQGLTVGKSKRIRAVLSWAMENNQASGESLVSALLAHLRSCGGFRSTSPNYVGEDPIAGATGAFKSHGFELTSDGDLRAPILAQPGTAAMSAALNSYVQRAMRGADDAALLLGTSKDLLEATAAHILVERNGSYPTGANFEGLLGMAYIALGLSTPQHPVEPGEPPQRKTERAMFALAVSVNAMRNKLGTGHGRPWLPDVSTTEASAAIRFMGTIAEWLLHAHSRRRGA